MNDNPNERTVVGSLLELFQKTPGWKVYRVQTSSSTYHVAMGSLEGRRMAILRGYSVGAGRLVDIRDSGPQAGGESLFDVDPERWVGRKLSFSTTTTSPVVEIAPETDEKIITVVTSALAPAPPSSPAPQAPAAPEYVRPPYPEDWVERAEYAAECLRRLYQRRGALEDIQKQQPLSERLNVAVGECALMLRAIAGKLGTAGG